MSSLARATLVLCCTTLACDTGERWNVGSHAAAHPTPVGSSSAGAGGADPDGDSSGSSGTPPITNPVTCPEQPWVLEGAIQNARDVGGTPLEEGGAVKCGSVFRGPPLTLTTTGCEQARALGLRTVIDLRIESERASRPDASCTGADFVPAPLPIPYGLAAADYLADLHAKESMAAIFHTFGDPSRYPIYFHCTWGRDRTGVVAAVLLLTIGVSREEVMAEYLLSQPKVGAYPNALEAVLDEIQAQGGPSAFLTSLGLSLDEIAVIRSHVVE